MSGSNGHAPELRSVRLDSEEVTREPLTSELIEFQNVVKAYPPNVMALDHASASFGRARSTIVGENGRKEHLDESADGWCRGCRKILLRRPAGPFQLPRRAISRDRHGAPGVRAIPEYSVWENVVLGLEPTRAFGRLDASTAQRQVQAKIDQYDLNLEVDAQVGDISIAARQKVEILKLLYREVSILILDEPTAVLTPQEVPSLFDELRRLRESGRRSYSSPTGWMKGSS
jgi:simple sugar transport system ATP-binding protein